MKSPSAKKNRQHIDTRQVILDEAEILFAEKGYFGVSLSEVAKKVGIAKSSLLHHIESKGKLYGLMQQRAFKEMKQLTLQSLDESESEIENIVSLIDGYFQWLLNNQVYNKIMIRSQLDNIGLSDKQAKSYFEPLYVRVEKLVRSGQKRGAIEAIEARTFVHHVSGSITSFFVFLHDFANLSNKKEEQLIKSFRKELETIVRRSLLRSS